MSNYAAPIRILQTDFRSGQIDQTLAMRVDSKAYPSGARSLKNMLLRSTGAVDRRPGSTTLAVLTYRSRLVEFEYDADEKYVFAFAANYLRIYNPDGTVATTFTGSTDCPWDADEVWELTFTQLADVMFLAHGDVPMQKITRTGSSTFTIDEYDFDSSTGGTVRQPHYKFEAPATTLAISNTAIGTGRTLTSSPGIFSSAWVGDRIRIFGKEIEITGHTNATTVTATVHQTVRKTLDPNPMRSTDGSGVVEVTHPFHGLANGATITLEGVSVSGADPSISEGNMVGARVITVVDDDHYTFTAGGADTANKSIDFGGNSVNIYTTAGTREWTEQAFSARRGYPSAIGLHENRLWMGGTDAAQTLLVGSVVGSYFNFDVGDGDDNDSVQAILSTYRSGRIRHIVSSRQLQIFTETGEVVVETAQGEPITPGGMRIRADTNYGCGSVRPLPFDGATIFMQRNGKALRELIYDYDSNAMASPSVSVAASDLIRDPHDIAVLYGGTSRPEQYAFLVNNDGTMACFHSVRAEELASFTPFEPFTGHTFDSVCVIGSTVYFSVLRGAAYHLDRFELASEDIWLDGAKSMGPVAATVTWALGSNYASKTVSVMSNGHYIGDYTANGSGTITLSEAVTDIVAGYDYGCEVIAMPPDKEINDGPLTGEIRRIVSITAHFHETVNATVNDKPWIGLSIGDDLSEPPTEFTGKKRFRLLGYNRDPDFAIRQDAPGKLTLLGFSTEVSI